MAYYRYQVIGAETIVELEKKVYEAMKNDWIPSGPIVIPSRLVEQTGDNPDWDPDPERVKFRGRVKVSRTLDLKWRFFQTMLRD